MNKALFLDRDGVINVEKNYVHKIEEFEFIEGVFDTLKYFQQRGYLLIIITNQAGIARGYYSEEDFHTLNNWLMEQFENQGVYITKVYYSPYHPVYGVGKYKKDSNCRKPNAGMLFQAQKEFNVDLAQSILVGDKESDIEAGINAGVGVLCLVRSGHKINEKSTKSHIIVDMIRDLIIYKH